MFKRIDHVEIVTDQLDRTVQFSPVTAATLPSRLLMFVTFHCIAKRASPIRRIHPAGTVLLARPGCPTLTGCGRTPKSRVFPG
jgi:hypothetical protein